MNLIDTNGIDFIFSESLSLSEDYFMAPDIKDESEMTELVHRNKLPQRIVELKNSDFFEEVKYLHHYMLMLNKHGGRSFFNMTGFGDISILAATHTILEVFKERKTQQLFDPSEEIVIFSKDKRLVNKIQSEFSNSDVVVKSLVEIV